jgi:hypothetical protein
MERMDSAEFLLSAGISLHFNVTQQNKLFFVLVVGD